MNRLQQLAKEICECVRRGRQCLIHFKNAGDRLREAKTHCPHGNSIEAKETGESWLKWLKENVPQVIRQAENYMKLSENWSLIEPYYARNPDLTINEALRLIPGAKRRSRHRRYRNLTPDANFSMNDIRVLVGDCEKTLPPIVDIGSAALVFTDPPYRSLDVLKHKVYETTGRLGSLFLRPDGVLAAYLGKYQHKAALDQLAEHLTCWHPLCFQHEGDACLIPRSPFIDKWKWVELCLKKDANIDPTKFDPVPDLIVTKSPPEKEYHPWQQKLEEVIWVIGSFTQPNELVVDLHMGSGTIAAACYLTGRRYIGCDIVPGYVAVAQHRLKAAEKGVEWKLEDQSDELQELVRLEFEPDPEYVKEYLECALPKRAAS